MEITPFLLAIDAGTSSLKGVVYDSQGQTLASAIQRYEYSSPHSGWAEADPQGWWAAFLAVLTELRQVLGGLTHVQALALTGQMHTAVLLDENQQAISPTILWLDRRAGSETNELQKHFNLPPYQLNSTYTLPKLYWLARHAPQVAHRTRTVLWVKDYLRFRLTGRLATDYTEAGGAALLNWHNMDWARDRLTWIGMNPDILPPLQSPTDAAGPLLEHVAQQLGLNPNIHVLTGAGDVLALVTAAPPQAGQVTCSLGTSSMVFCPIQEENIIDPHQRLYTYPLLPYRLLGGVSSTTGAALQWAWQTLFSQYPYEDALQNALLSPPGANGLFFLPFLSGERSPYWNDNLRGGFYGLTLSHTPRDMMRAVMEGVAFSLRYLLKIYADLSVPIHQIALAGGGAQVAGLPQIIANICQLPVVIYTGQETVTNGLYAYACQKLLGDSFDAALLRTFKNSRQIHPDLSFASLYNQIFSQYHLMADFANKNLQIMQA